MPSTSYEKLIRYAFNIVSGKRYTEFEMNKKLTQYSKKRAGIEDGEVEIVIKRLIELKYLNDKQFVIDYANERSKIRPRGLNLIKRELRMKGLDKELIDNGLRSVDIDEQSIATDLLSKKMQRWRAHDYPKQRLKAYQFLYSRGFNRDAIYSAVESCYDRFSSQDRI